MKTVRAASGGVPILAMVAWLATPGVGRCGETDVLREELTALARQVARVLQDEGASAIVVGPFAGPAGKAASGQAGIRKILIEVLQEAGVTVGGGPGLEIQGSYAPVEDDRSGRLALDIEWSIKDRDGKILGKGRRGVFGDAVMAQVLGLTVEFKPDAPDEQKERRIRTAAENPEVYISGRRISAGRSSRFAIEVLVKEGTRYVARQPRQEDGQAFVSIDRDEVYAVRLINDSSHDAMAALSIDGLNCFEFCEKRDGKTGGPLYRQVIIPAQTSATVPGWYVSDRSFESFQVSEYASSAVGRLERPADSDGVGTITAQFYAAWSREADRPSDEPGRVLTAMTRGANATGRGEKISSDVTESHRYMGVLRDSISVRYTR